ncbi:thiamine kinase-like enzyme [Chitinophaga sp. OAE865]
MYTDLYSTTDIISHVEEILGEKVNRFENILSGMTNWNYKIFTNHCGYVYRLPGNASNLLVNRYNEGLILQKIRDVDIDVDTIYFNFASGEKITKLIDNYYCDISDNRHKAIIACNLLKRLHGSGIIFENKFCVMEKIDFYETLMINNRIPFHNDYSIIKRRLQILNGYLEQIGKISSVPCHNDPVPENIILDIHGRSYLIDWEYAGMNDCLWDLAAFSLENNFDTISEQYFISLYYQGAIDPLIEQRLLIHKISQDILWSLWASIKSFFGTDFSMYGKRRFERGSIGLQTFNYLF